jgi:hypothetical protein
LERLETDLLRIYATAGMEDRFTNLWGELQRRNPDHIALSSVWRGAFEYLAAGALEPSSKSIDPNL